MGRSGSSKYEVLFKGNQKDNVVIYLYNNRNSYELSETLKSISEIAFETDFFLKEVKTIQKESGFGLIVIYAKDKKNESKNNVKDLIEAIKKEINNLYLIFGQMEEEIKKIKKCENEYKNKENSKA